MKKIISIALLSIVPLTLASCSSGNQKQDAQSSSTSKTEKVSKNTSPKKASSKSSSKVESESSSEKSAASQASSSRDQSSTSTSSDSKPSSSASNSTSTTSQSDTKNLSREDLTAAEQKNNNQPLTDESIQSSDAALNLIKAKYGDKGWKVAYSSIGNSSPIYFHITSDHDGSYYVYADGEVQNAGGDLSDHASEIQNIK